MAVDDSIKHLPGADRLEGVFEMLDRRAALVFRPSDGDHVEAGRGFEQVMALEVDHRQAGKAVLLITVDGFGRMTRVVRDASFHFDEYDRPAVHGDQVNLAAANVRTAGDDGIAESLEEAGRCRLPRWPRVFGARALRRDSAAAARNLP